MGIQQKMIKNPLLILTICSMLVFSAHANEASETDNTETTEQTTDVNAQENVSDLNPLAVASVRKESPRSYTVKSGDTLWAISGHFLDDPWYWPELWARNPQINNPHLIYPGDIISLIYVNGQPVFQVSRNGEVVSSSAAEEAVKVAETQAPAATNTIEKAPSNGALKQVKLSPHIRSTSLQESIKTIPIDAIEQFTTRPKVVTLEEWEAAPYIIGSDDKHLILSQGNRIYIRGEIDKARLRYNIYRKDDKLVDPKSGDVLGYEVVYAGEARITKYGSPSTARINKARREVIIGDRLLATDNAEINNLFFPKPPEAQVDGQIISLFDAIAGIAQYQVAVINLGKRDGLEVGHILSTYTRGETVRDRFESQEGQINIQLPNERSGVVMLFKIFDRVSYGLVLEANRVIRRLDQVRTPYQ